MWSLPLFLCWFILIQPLEIVFEQGPILVGSWGFMNGLSFAEYCAQEKGTSVTVWLSGSAYNECETFVARKRQAFVVSFYTVLGIYTLIKILAFILDYVYFKCFYFPHLKYKLEHNRYNHKIVDVLE